MVSCTILYAPYTRLTYFYDWCIFGYSLNHLCKTIRHTPFPMPLTPLLVHRANSRSQKPKENFSVVFLKMTKYTDRQHLAQDIVRGFQSNIVKFSTFSTFSTLVTVTIGLWQETITWYKTRQARYYSRTGTLKQRSVKLEWLRSLCFYYVPERE